MRVKFTISIKSLAVFLLMSVGIGAMAANEKRTVGQVTTAVDITADWDYIINADTPFGTGGVVNIVNTDHAVVILTKVKPSAGIKLLDSHVKINGQKAVDGTNCQVKMYNKGCIIMPYASDFQPLTCYTGTGYSGTSYSGYTTGSNGGYMKTLTDTELKNNFKSFKLKRGYMVTFATGTDGWGYSRCFIAAAEDLEMNLPAALSGKVSSYRLFKWLDFGKTGIANNSDAAAADALNVQGCYIYNKGENRLPDVEWLPHKVHKWWPGVEECGQSEYACTMKTDNEPANPDDDKPGTVDEVLGYWEDAMRTGLRLCSPSTYDGKGNKAWFDKFFTAIDARGWRCDIYDIHCYWADFSALSTHYNYYKRPLLISEWMWGYSWNGGGGAFGSNVTEQQIITTTSNILNTLNNTAYVERYFYWNGESKGHVYENGGLTDLGRVYAASDGGLGYNKNYEFVPKVVMKQPYSLSGTVSGNDISFTWKDSNGDMMDEIRVQYKLPNASSWTTLATVERKDKTGSGDQSYSYSGTFDNAESYQWRIQDALESKTSESNTLGVATSSTDNATFLPTNLSDFYFQFYSKEAFSNLVWAVAPTGEDRVQYKAYNSNHGDDAYQLWILERNSNGGYSLRNLGEPGYLIASPKSWNFVTRNSDYTKEAPQTAYGFDYNSSGDYWVCRNLHHSMYVGLWDDDKNFAAGEALAGNRDSEDTADHIGIRMILRSEIDGGDVAVSEEATIGKSYYLYNVDAGKVLTGGNSYGTAASLGSSGLVWTLENGNNSGLYSFKNSTTDNTYLYVNGEDRMWVDGSASIGCPWEDVTSTYVKNANMSNTTGWTLSKNSSSVAGSTNKDSYAIEFYAGWSNADVKSYSALQSITLPAGTYKLTSHAFYREGQLYNTDSGTSRAYLKAGSKTVLLPTLGSVSLYRYANTLAEAADALASDTYETSIEFTLSTSSTIEIGVTGTFSVAKSWCPVGAFKLYKKVTADATKTRDFKLSLDDDGFYTLQVDPDNVKYGTAALGTRYVGFVGDLGDTPYVLAAPKDSYHSGVGTKWILMSPKAYNTYRMTIIEAASCRQQIWPLVISARAAGVGEDEIAVYENPLSTASDIASAAESLRAKLLEVKASESTPVDYSFFITNGNCASKSHEGWTTTGEWSSNTSFYHNGDALLTNRFYESWVKGPATLDDRTLSQTLTDLPAGVYRLALDIIATQQDNASVEVSGVTLFLGDQEVSCHSANGVPETFTTPEYIVTEGTPVTLGLKIKNTTANWVAFDNFRLIYLGLPAVPNDVNGDTEVNAKDVSDLISYLLGNTPENFDIDVANINGDGEVDIRDVTTLIKIILEDQQQSLPASSQKTTNEASSNRTR